MSTAAALIATTRFGFAPRRGELAAVGRDPKGWVRAQLDLPVAASPAPLPASRETVTATLAARAQRKLQAQAADARPMKDEFRQIYLAEVGARMNAAIFSDAPLQERLVHFWSNHFTVSALRPVVRGFVGAYEREAIRPHVLGRFSDMLLAVARHPAMLFYLDNVQSVGPASQVGSRRAKGLNENLAREILELHTLGVDGGYTQRDVESFARILTGWTIARPQDPGAGSFRFVPQIHEPGPKTLLGKSYGDGGTGEGEAALRDLARHPATARHLARKLAVHFIADDPPKAAVERIARVFLETGGDLKPVTEAVIDAPEAWEKPFAKLRTPSELVIAACRAVDLLPPAESVVGSLRVLDHTPFVAPSPAGWPDTAGAWISPESVVRRAEWAQVFAERLPNPPDPAELAADIFADALPEETRETIRRAPSRRVGLALLIAAPEFQRR
jgi:uncharacterized protein (DUF1800 family)